MDKDVLQAKLEMLMRCVERIKSQNIQTLEDLENSLDKQDIILLNLQRAVQVCVDIGNHIVVDYGASPVTMADTFKILFEKNVISKSNADNLAKAVGFRNIAVHQYEVIDNKIIYSIVKNNLSDFVEFAASIARL
ncbi:type VII toxin-antitoxin system HepT family RNase toxin [Fibrobacter sp. HC4]|uniref:type VII toxin-antitoxin system HepT family RNase toxin n=1 Tax=Fibrobacter sp. HC4 TaxID=3239812 RepID=UPI0020187882|nr:DUF86 domain-containing protein [Fibrobacter succinogenes]MCL4101511.1 hypothetical protein [Fibrobacter succinogenes]MCQ2124366.1 DUF86 domain-containing protein [Fibrobacter sp.]